MKTRMQRFDNALEVCANRANELFKAKGAAVICSYCGKMMPKADAYTIYDIAKNELTYHHDECFQLYEHGLAKEGGA